MSQLTENRTVELFYQQARSLIFKGSLEVDSDIVFQLAALSLQVIEIRSKLILANLKLFALLIPRLPKETLWMQPALEIY